jgi:DNA-binding XRE family transcriptional regulator|tara:strand:- start:45 stop:161 length:117 start_codon:yes stop_codon:yes gene_type:complete
MYEIMYIEVPSLGLAFKIAHSFKLPLEEVFQYTDTAGK